MRWKATCYVSKGYAVYKTYKHWNALHIGPFGTDLGKHHKTARAAKAACDRHRRGKK